MRIYIVEDTSSVARALQRRLTRTEVPFNTITTVVADNGSDAAELFGTLSIEEGDIAIIDGLDGHWRDAVRHAQEGGGTAMVFTGDPRKVRENLSLVSPPLKEFKIFGKAQDEDELYEYVKRLYEGEPETPPDNKLRAREALSRCGHDWKFKPSPGGYEWSCERCLIAAPSAHPGFCPDAVIAELIKAFES